jgi:hypothetical protein
MADTDSALAPFDAWWQSKQWHLLPRIDLARAAYEAGAASRTPPAPAAPVDGERAETVAKEARRIYRSDPAVPADESFWTASHFLAVKKAVEALLRLPREREGWRTMDDAPKDGTRVLGCWPGFGNGPFVGIIVYKREWYPLGRKEVECWWVEKGGPTAGNPTHWQPLPPPPPRRLPPMSDIWAQKARDVAHALQGRVYCTVTHTEMCERHTCIIESALRAAAASAGERMRERCAQYLDEHCCNKCARAIAAIPLDEEAGR